MVGCLPFGLQANAADTIYADSNEAKQLFFNKPMDKPTVDYFIDNGVKAPRNISYSANTIRINTYKICDNDGNLVKTLYTVAYGTNSYNPPEMTEEEYKELLSSTEAYKTEEKTYTYKPSNYGVNTVDELMEKLSSHKFTEQDPKVAYTNYIESLPDSSFVQFSPYENGYTLTPTDTIDKNTITKYEINKATWELTPVNYNVNLTKTEYGTPEGDSAKYFEWSKDENEKLKFSEVETPTEGNTTITYRYNNPDTNIDSKTYDTIYDNQSTAEEYKTNGSYHYYSGGALKVNEGETISIKNALFKDNVANVINFRDSANIYVNGGALNNKGTISELSADFINNGITIEDAAAVKYPVVFAYGEAIYNEGSIGNINGNFVNNTFDPKGISIGGVRSNGGAIYNEGSIGNITGNFVNNSVNSKTQTSAGVIYNSGKSTKYATIENINGTFIGNKGGAIWNGSCGIINKISGNFIGNTEGGENNDRYNVSAIYNSSKINQITGNFINNNNITIDNAGTINSISGDFIGNSNTAISNTGTINSISGNFIGNYNAIMGKYIVDRGSYIGNIDSISGNFIGNTGDVIYNSNVNTIIGNFIGNTGEIKGNIGTIIGDFIGNSGVISGTIGSITADYIGNTAGLSGRFGSITGYFIKNNSLITPTGTYDKYGFPLISLHGNTQTPTQIKGDFVENTAKTGIIHSDSAYSTYYGARPVDIESINGNFINNTVQKEKEDRFNRVAPGVLSLRVTSEIRDGYGTILTSKETTTNIINSSFINNKVIDNEDSTTGAAGAIFSQKDLNIIADNGVTEISGNYVEKNGVKDYLGIYMGSRFDNWVRYDNKIRTTNSKLNLIAKNNGQLIIKDKITGESGVDSSTSSTLDGEKTVKHYYGKDGKELDAFKYYTTDNKYIPTIKQWVTEEILFDKNDNEIKGYRYYNEWKRNPDLNNYVNYYYMLDKDNNIIKTYVYDSSNKIYYTLSEDGTLTDATNYEPRPSLFEEYDKEMTDKLGDQIEYYKNYKINIDGDKTGLVQINNDISAVKDATAPEDYNPVAEISLSNTQLHLSNRDNVLDGNNLTLNSGTFNMINVLNPDLTQRAGIAAINNFTLNGDVNMLVDVDLANQTMDRFTANNYTINKGSVNVIGMNLLTDAPADRDITEIYFAEKGLKDHVNSKPMNLSDAKNQQFELYTPIYKYNSKYVNKDDAGYFIFAKGHINLNPEDPTIPITPGGNTGNPSDAYNPAVLASPVATQAVGQAAVSETFRYVFEHADAFTQLPSLERISHIKSNQYALSTDYNENLGEIATEFNNKAGWFRPYASFESMNLSNGPKVSTVNYGSLVGYDSDFHQLRNGWTTISTGYLGYNGSQAHFKGVDTTMNGGILGLTQTFYKGNFWTALTASAGAGVAESRTMYGKEDSTMLMAGLGSKTGYNFEFKDGKYILQPIMFLSYTFVNTFDYTNAAGVRIKSDPMHTIQLNPSVRFIANTKNSWQPYASVGMVWNILNETDATANGIKLPGMHTKPYVEYGVGLQKRFKDKFTAFGQAMIRNGGRNGIALTAGFRWNLGKEGRPIEKVMTPSPQKLSHSLTPSPRERVGVRGQSQPKIPSLRGGGVNKQYTSQTPSLRGADATRQSITKLNLLSQTDMLARTNNTLTTTNDRKIVKQLTQKATQGGKPQNTTRTTYRATLKQL